MIRLFLFAISLLLLQSCSDSNGQNASYSLGSKVTFTGTSINSVTTSVPVNSTQIVNSGLNVVSGQSFKVNVISSALYEQPKRYRVIARMDPRINGPVVFWAPYNYSTGYYSPGWTTAIEYQNSFADFLSPNTAYQQYYNYTLPVVQTPNPTVRFGDAIALRIIQSTEFYNNLLQPSVSDTTLPTIGPRSFLAILNSTGGIDNRIIDTTDFATLCSYISCTNNLPNITNVYSGYANLRPSVDPTTLPQCPSTDFVGSLCQRNNGIGLTLSAGGFILKAGTSEFVNLVTTGSSQYVYQILSSSSGNLSFGYDTNMAGTFLASTNPLTATPYQNMVNLGALTSQGNSSFLSPASFSETLSTQIINRFIAGRYLLEMEIGSSTGAYTQQKIQSITYGYDIIQGGSLRASGQITDGNLEINAPATGTVYFKIINNNYPEIAGNMIFSAQSYTGSILVSSFLNSYIVGPLKSQILLTSATLFNLISANPQFILVAQLMLTFYIFIYGIMFSLGAVEVTVKDMTHRILKILIIGQLFSQNAWAFFQQYLFGFFLNGIDQLMNWVTGDTSTVGNIFGFIDPILTAYFSPQLWFIILIYFGFFFLGYAIPAFFLMMGVFYLVRALLMAIVGYLMAYVSLCVVISIGPLILLTLLFEKTRSMFDNWINIMLGYVLQPSFIIIFILFINQLTSGILIAAKFGVALIDLFPFKFNMPGLNLNLGTLFVVSAYAPYPWPPTAASVMDVLRISGLFFCLMKLIDSVTKIAPSVIDRLVTVGGEGAASAGKSMQLGDNNILKPTTDALSNQKKRIYEDPRRIITDPYDTAVAAGKAIKSGAESLGSGAASIYRGATGAASDFGEAVDQGFKQTSGNKSSGTSNLDVPPSIQDPNQMKDSTPNPAKQFGEEGATTEDPIKNTESPPNATPEMTAKTSSEKLKLPAKDENDLNIKFKPEQKLDSDFGDKSKKLDDFSKNNSATADTRSQLDDKKVHQSVFGDIAKEAAQEGKNKQEYAKIKE